MKMAEGWKRGQGTYSKVSDGKDRVRQGGGADKPHGSPRQLNIETIEDHSKIGMGFETARRTGAEVHDETGGAARKLPKDMR